MGSGGYDREVSRSVEARTLRHKQVRRVLIIELLLNILVGASKAVYGVLTGNLTITADAVHSATDAGANIVGFFVLHKSGQPADREHPYGHRKFEVLGAAALGLAVGALGINLGVAALRSLADPHDAPSTDALGLLIILGTLVVNIFVARYEARKARELDSKFLAADAAHTASDVLVTMAVLASYGASHIGIGWADDVGALVLVVVIMRVAWTVLRDNLGILVDQRQIDEVTILELVMAIDGVESCHRIRSHGMPDEVIVDLHVQADGDITLSESHRIAHLVEATLRTEIPLIVDVTVHMEPAGDPIEKI